MKKARKRHGVIANFYNNYSRLCELFGGSWYAYVIHQRENKQKMEEIIKKNIVKNYYRNYIYKEI